MRISQHGHATLNPKGPSLAPQEGESCHRRARQASLIEPDFSPLAFASKHF